jgi:hypothetical protein
MHQKYKRPRDIAPNGAPDQGCQTGYLLNFCFFAILYQPLVLRKKKVWSKCCNGNPDLSACVRYCCKAQKAQTDAREKYLFGARQGSIST